MRIKGRITEYKVEDNTFTFTCDNGREYEMCVTDKMAVKLLDIMQRRMVITISAEESA